MLPCWAAALVKLLLYPLAWPFWTLYWYWLSHDSVSVSPVIGSFPSSDCCIYKPHDLVEKIIVRNTLILNTPLFHCNKAEHNILWQNFKVFSFLKLHLHWRPFKAFSSAKRQASSTRSCTYLGSLGSTTTNWNGFICCCIDQVAEETIQFHCLSTAMPQITLA
jgi:hypothetical protein